MVTTQDMFKIDYKKAIARVGEYLKRETFLNFKKDGIIVGLSGGIDSSLTAALSVSALGKDKVAGLILPEKESDPVSRVYAEKLAKKLGICYEVFDITGMLETAGIYQRRDKAIKKMFSDYGEGSTFRIYLQQNLKKKAMINFFSIEVNTPSGKKEGRLSKEAYLEIIAATHVKLRTRMMMLYYFGQLKNYLVAGTSNRTEVTLGNVCKYGDGGVDLEVIAHLYKTQVMDLSRHMGLPEEIIQRTPTPDMFSMPTTDEEWYFGLAFEELDPLLYAYENKISKEEIAELLNLTSDEVENVLANFDKKHKATRNVFTTIPRLK